MKKKKMKKISIILLLGILLGCSLHQQTSEEKTVQGVLKHFPSNARSAHAWYGHNFIIGNTPILPTDTVPEAILKKHVGKVLSVSGIWYPGKQWKPTKEEMNIPMPVNPKNKVIVRDDGLRASSIKIIKN